MIRHKIRTRHQSLYRRVPVKLIRQGIKTALRLEGVNVPCEISVLITDDAGILEINREFRGKDRATDVLSFPLQELCAGDFSAEMCEKNPQTGLIALGDIVLSAERADKQAREYGHRREREISYLIIHSVLHLLGYDHTDEAQEKKLMRKREKIILRHLNAEIRCRSNNNKSGVKIKDAAGCNKNDKKF